MKKIVKLIKILGFISLIVLAGIGIGLSGGVPIPQSKNRRDPEKEKIELIDKNDRETNSMKELE